MSRVRGGSAALPHATCPSFRIKHSSPPGCWDESVWVSTLHSVCNSQQELDIRGIFTQSLSTSISVRSGPSGGGPGEGYSTLRRPRSSSQQQQQQPSWLLDADHQHHLSDSGSSGCMAGRDGIRKCTCGQKMRLPSSGPALGHHHPHHSTGSGQQQQQPGESHSRSDDGLAGIATLRRPVKRKTRSQIPSAS